MCLCARACLLACFSVVFLSVFLRARMMCLLFKTHAFACAYDCVRALLGCISISVHIKLHTMHGLIQQRRRDRLNLCKRACACACACACVLCSGAYSYIREYILHIPCMD